MSQQLKIIENDPLRNDDNYIEGFLIGTKPNKNGWSVHPNFLQHTIKKFEGKPFIIIPEKIAHGIDAHFHGSTKQETIDGYKKYSHGIIEKVTGPHSYNDGTNDFYYNHITHLSNSKSASILTELGAKTKVPFATSPHIWQEDSYPSDVVELFDPIGLALVDEGAYGDISIINQHCKGSKDTCHRSLGASHCGCCQNTDEKIAKILSSHFSKVASTTHNIMQDSQNNSTSNNNSGGTVAVVPTDTRFTNPTVNPQGSLTQEKPQQEPKDPNQITLTKEQYDAFLKNEQESKQAKKQLEELINEKKIETLNSIFTADIVQDENTRNNLIEKFKNYDNKFVKEFHSEYTKHVLPAIVEKAKSQAKEETANEIKNKSKGASILRPEPKIVTTEPEQSKSASVQQTSRNEVTLLRKYLFGEF